MAVTAEQIAREVLDETNIYFDQCRERISHCVGQLTEEQIWWRPREEMNSIGNLLLHLTGNVQQWIVAGIGGAEDVRRRPLEFSERGPIPKRKLLAQLEAIVTEAKQVLSAASADQMLARRRIQGCNVTGFGAIFDCAPHFKGHTQEIICLTRLQLGEAYRFYWEPRTEEEKSAGKPN